MKAPIKANWMIDKIAINTNKLLQNQQSNTIFPISLGKYSIKSFKGAKISLCVINNKVPNKYVT